MDGFHFVIDQQLRPFDAGVFQPFTRQFLSQAAEVVNQVGYVGTNG